MRHWPGSVALLATATLLAVFLDRLTDVPIWLPPVIAALMIVPVAIVRRTGRHRLGRWLGLAFPATATVGVVPNLPRLPRLLVQHQHRLQPD